MLTVPTIQSPPCSDMHSRQNSETSESSHKNKAGKRTKGVKRVSKLEIDEINDRVKSQFQKNKRNYDKLRSMNPYFSMKLYSPDNNFTTDDYDTTSVELMMKQLELLLDDGHALQKEMMKTTLRKSQHQSKDNHYLDQWRHHYSYLRKVWSNPNEEQAIRPFDLIEQLNKKVVIIKNNIHSTMQLQKKCFDTRGQNHDQYEFVTRKINEVTQEVQEYTLLKQRYETLRMSYEDIYEKYHKLTEQINYQMGEKNDMLERIKTENEELKHNLKEYKEKLLNSEIKEATLQGKIKELQIRNRQKKEERQSIESSLSHTVLKTSQLFNFDKIRFTKMDNKQLSLYNTEEHKLHQKNKHNITISAFETHDKNNKEEPEVKPFSDTVNQESLENINCLNGNRQNRLDLSTARSMDKKGRFSRMRSPCNTKLQRIREENNYERRVSNFCSPRMKQMKEGKQQQAVALQS